MDSNRMGNVKLFNLSSIEAKDEYDEKLERCHMFVQNIIDGHSEKEAHDELMSTVCRSPVSHEEVCIGLLVSILTDASNSQRYYRDLTYVSRDGMIIVINHLNQIVIDKYPKMHDNSRTQLIWMIREMIKNSISGIDTVCHNLLRQIAGGDISPKNIYLAETILDLLIEHRSWLETINILIATVVYTYLRLIDDHGNPLYSKLRQKEVEFCVSLLREKFSECIPIGRDLVRLLQNVARIPEFEKFWKDLFTNPGSLNPGFTGIHQLMCIRTSRRFLQCRLTPDMEKKIVFLTSQVKFGQQKRYQEWFQKIYLSTPESQTLRCDVIRFICGVIHPTNEVLCSDIIPRWAIIGWLLTSCTSNVAASNAKLSLFYDWFFYDHERDNIMNIEPAILVMFHSLRSHPAITATLLDFLCRMSQSFCPSLTSLVKSGIRTSLQQIVEKRVLANLSVLFDSPKLDRELRTMVRDSFPEFCSISEVSVPSGNSESSHVKNMPEIMVEDNNIAVNHTNNNNIINNTNNVLDNAKFSDDDDDSTIKNKSKKSKGNSRIKNDIKNDIYTDKSNDFQASRSSTYPLPKIDLKAHIEQYNSQEVRNYLLELNNEKDNENRCEIMEKLLQTVMQEDDNDQDNLSNLVLCLLFILHDELNRKVFPDTTIDDEALEDSIGTALFVMFRNLCQTAEEDPNRIPLLNVLAEMGTNHTRIGYLLLYYLKASKALYNRMSAYREYAKTVGKDLTACLLSDLRSCQDDDVKMFCYIIPETYAQFPNITIGNAELLNMIVSCIDSSQLQDLVSQILQGNMRMFRKDSMVSILNASLEWETFEQYCLWQLIAAHNIPIDHVISILPKLEYNVHSEPLTNILLMLQRESPSANLVKHILSREAKANDFFVVSVLSIWTQNHAEKLSELINSYLSSKVNSPAKNRKRNANNKVQSSSNIELILAHLDQLRQKMKQLAFFNNETIQKCLTQIQAIASDSQKTRYSDLLALAEDNDPKPPSKRGKNAKGKGRIVHSNANNDSNTESDASEDESPPIKQTKHAQTRKKRKAVVGSDSD